MKANIEILVFATKGSGSNEEERIKALLSQLSTTVFPFDRKNKLRSSIRLLRTILRDRPKLVVMEGTGLGGGIPLLVGRIFGVPYVVSSGDAVGPWIGTQVRILAPLFSLYEYLLCRFCAGFIGWTPYLVGRAMTFGAKRAMTAAGFAPHPLTDNELAGQRTALRRRYGIPQDAIVFGILGSLTRSPVYDYSYGKELIFAFHMSYHKRVYVLICGDGDGKGRLEMFAGDYLGSRITLTGNVDPKDVLGHMAAMDVALLPQSVDKVGMFRYTTKIAEYVAARVPVVTNQIPLSYDFGDKWGWRLPGSSPWDPVFLSSLADLMDCVTPEEITQKKAAVPQGIVDFDHKLQIERAGRFVKDLIEGMGKERWQPRSPKASILPVAR